jgi:hypothetical protein
MVVSRHRAQGAPRFDKIGHPLDPRRRVRLVAAGATIGLPFKDGHAQEANPARRPWRERAA